MKKHLFLVAALVFAVVTAHGQGAGPLFWQQAKGPIGGMVTSMTIDSAQHLTISTLPAGFFRSTNGGDTWKSLNGGLKRLQGKQVESEGSDYVYASTFFNEFMRLKKGDTVWQYLDPGKNISPAISIVRFVINPKQYMIAATTRYGILRSKDHGDNWEQSGIEIKDSTFSNMAMSFNGHLYAMTQGGNVYRSTDDGDSWTKLPTQAPGATGLNALCMAISKNDDIIYGTGWGYVIRSANQGVTWDTVFKHPDRHNIEAMVCSSDGSLYMTTHSNINDSVQTRTGGFFRSLGNGASGTWVAQDQSEHGESKFCISINAAGQIFQSSVSEGVIRSTNNGTSWELKNNGLLAELTTSIAVNSKGSIFTTTASRVFRADDGMGDLWLQVNVPTRETPTPPRLYCAPNDVLYYFSSFGLFRSDNAGNTWLHVILEDQSGVRYINDVVQLPSGDVLAAVESTDLGLMTSKDNGYHFEKAPNLPPGEIITAIACAPIDTVIIANNGTTYYRSENKGINWTKLPSENPGCVQLAIHPNGTYLSRTPIIVMVSSDKGVSWNQVFPDSSRLLIHDWSLYSFIIDRFGAILVTTDSGVYRSRAYPYSDWEFVGSGLVSPGFDSTQYTTVSELAQNKQTGVFFAASRGQSVFRSLPDLGVHSPISASVAATAEQNYPNPFSRMTSIRVKMKMTGHASIKVYDLLGRERYTAFSGVIGQGEQEISVNADELSSGSYIYVIDREGEKPESNIMTLTK